MVWPNRGGGFGITEIVDVVNLQTEEARRYHEPRVLDTSIFFPMNWTLQLTCDRIRPDDCVFNPVTDTKQPRKSYDVKLNNLQVTIILAHLVVTVLKVLMHILFALLTSLCLYVIEHTNIF